MAGIRRADRTLVRRALEGFSAAQRNRACRHFARRGRLRAGRRQPWTRSLSRKVCGEDGGNAGRSCLPGRLGSVRRQRSGIHHDRPRRGGGRYAGRVPARDAGALSGCKLIAAGRLAGGSGGHAFGVERLAVGEGLDARSAGSAGARYRTHGATLVITHWPGRLRRFARNLIHLCKSALRERPSGCAGQTASRRAIIMWKASVFRRAAAFNQTGASS